MDVTSKRCTKCNIVKPTEDFNFHTRSKGQRRGECRPCEAKRTKRYRTLNKAALRIRQAKWTAQHKTYIHEYKLRVQYGLTGAEYDAMSMAQAGVCAICHQPESQIDYRTKALKRLAVDHDHQSKQIRGLLCANCNKGLGNFQDSPSVLTAALSYLGRHGKQ